MDIKVNNDGNVTYKAKGKQAATNKDFTINFSAANGGKVSNNRFAKLGKIGSVFATICGADGDGKTLTEPDLKKAKALLSTPKNKFKSLGVQNMKYDEHAGVLSVFMSNGEYLRVDLHTRAELGSKAPKPQATKTPQKPDAPKAEPKAQTEAKPASAQQSSSGRKLNNNTKWAAPLKLKQSQKSKEQSFSLENYLKDFWKPAINIFHKAVDTNNKYSQRADNPLQFKNIPKEYNPYIKRTARHLKVSEYFVRHLLSTESFIPVARDIGDGVITIGFGHTNKAKYNNKIKKGDKISLDKAFRYFEQDVKDARDDARKHFTPTKGDYKGAFRYDQLPQSFKEALIDVAYNRGPGVMASDTIYMHLRSNLKGGKSNIPAAAVRMRQEEFRNPQFEGGLRKRNIYRFLLAIRSLTGSQKLSAMRRFNRDEYDEDGNLVKSYYTTTLNELSLADKKQLQSDWNAVKRAAEYQAKQEKF